MQTPYDFGAKGDGLADDTKPLQDFLDAGGGAISDGRFRFNGPLRYSSGLKIEEWIGTLAYHQGWDGGYALRSARNDVRTSDILIDATKRGRIEMVSGKSTKPRKGIGITYTDEFTLLRPTVTGGKEANGINLYALEVRGSSKGHIKGGLMSVLSHQEGSDGIHFTESCANVLIEELETLSGDDGTSVTLDNEGMSDCTIERLVFRHCSINNVGHSAIKGLIKPSAKNVAIRNILYDSCDLKTTLSPTGQGAPIFLDGTGGIMEDITVQGGKLRVIASTNYPCDPMVYLKNVRRFSLVDTEVTHLSRIMVKRVGDCSGFDWRTKTEQVALDAQGKPRKVPKPSKPTAWMTVE